MLRGNGPAHRTPQADAPSRWLPPPSLLLLCLALAAATRLSAQQPASGVGTAPVVTVIRQTPAPVQQPGSVPMATPIPFDLDPDLPGLSRQERFRRARIVLEQQRQYMREVEERRARGEAVYTPIPLPAGTHATPTPQPSPPAAPTTNTLSTTATRSIARGTSGTSETRRSGLELSERATPPRATLYLDPASKTIRTGERFATQVRLLNPEHLTMDSVQIILAYPPKSLRPLAVHQSALQANLQGDASLTQDAAEGVLSYRATLKKPMDGRDLPLVTIEWEGLAPADGLQINPASARESSAAFWNGTAITAPLTGLNTTLAGARVNVRATDPTTPQGAQFVVPTLESMQALLVGLPNQAALRKPTLWIAQPPAGTPLKAGAWLTIDLGIENPDAMAFDEVKLAGRFDPNVLEITDSDEGNWIGDGVNLLDGPFHNDWRWDLHFTNTVQSRFGYFFYHMAMTTYREQPSGTLARIFSRVRRDTTAPVIQWLFDSKAGFDQPSTAIYLLGENVLTRGTELAGRSEILKQDALLSRGDHEKADPKSYRGRQP